VPHYSFTSVEFVPYLMVSCMSHITMSCMMTWPNHKWQVTWHCPLHLWAGWYS